MVLMRQNPDVMNVRTDYDERRPYIEVELDPVATAQLGMNRTLAELELMLNTGEVKLGQVWEGNYEVPVKLKDIHNEELDCDGIGNLYMSAGINSVPLRQIADARQLGARPTFCTVMACAASQSASKPAEASIPTPYRVASQR